MRTVGMTYDIDDATIWGYESMHEFVTNDDNLFHAPSRSGVHHCFIQHLHLIYRLWSCVALVISITFCVHHLNYIRIKRLHNHDYLTFKFYGVGHVGILFSQVYILFRGLAETMPNKYDLCTRTVTHKTTSGP